MKLTKYLPLLLILTGIGSSFAQEKDQSSYIRYKQGSNPTQDGDLQIAVTDYISSNSKVTVTLYGVVHVADAEYYKRVQQDLDKYDAVLYEGIKTDQKPNPETKGLNAIQKLLGNILGLQFQKDGIDYKRPNLVHADITFEELNKSMDGQSITPFGQYLNDDNLKIFTSFTELAGDLIKSIMDAQPELRSSLKAQFAQQLNSADVTKILNPKMYQSIVVERNQIVINVLEKQLKECPDKKTYAIFYGAAHMPDFNSRLEKLGYKKTTHRWLTAWHIGEGSEENSDSLKEKPKTNKDGD